MKILITNPGRKNYLVKFFLDIKKKYLKNLQIHISDINKNCSTFYINKNIKTHILPSVKNNKHYANSLIKLIKRHQLKIIFPVTDLDLVILSKLKKKLGKLNCNAIISDTKIIKTCIDKKLANEFLIKNDFNIPETYKSLNYKKIKFPLIVKDIKGNGSKGVLKITNLKFLKSIKLDKLIIQKYLKGEEYNIDILNDLKGNYLDHCSKIKLEMRDGETFKSKIVKNTHLDKIAKDISQSIKHIGNLDCDLIYYKKKFYIIDLNPRFGGGYPFTHVSGKNYIFKLISLVIKKKYHIQKRPNIITGMKSLDINYYK